MNRAALRLAVTKTLKVYKGEGGRVLSFSFLHVLISIVIGMTGTVVDAFAVGSTDPRRTYLLYGASAVLLLTIGLVYAGVTDRTDKRRMLTRVLSISVVISLVGAAVLASAGGVGAAGLSPLVLDGLFVWRFLIGIFLLMVFWDLTPFYFNARQGKRLFPLLAIGGAVGYSLGSLAAAGLSQILPPWAILVVIGLLTIGAVLWFLRMRRDLSILDSPRYRDRSLVAELREGFSVFWGNPFLRTVGWNTVLFGVLSGFIVFTYNALVTARTSGTTEAAELIGIQRAVVTILQATIFTKVMSQSAVGGKGRASVIQQTLFLVLGTAAFAVSMVGVADFTRQIEVALMSPAAIAAFAFLPARYRGRVMVLNNLGAVAVGILIATILVATIAPHVDPLWFAYPIAFLMVLRIVFGVILNKRYTALLAQDIVSDRKLNLSKIDENAGSILRDDTLFTRIQREIGQQSESTRTFVLGRLARAVETPSDIERVAPFFKDVSPELRSRWLETLSRVDFDRYREEIDAALDSENAGVRVFARFEMLRRLWKNGFADEFHHAVEDVVSQFQAAIREESDRFTEFLEIILRTEIATGESLADVPWTELTEEQKHDFLELLSEYPHLRYLSLVEELLGDPLFASESVSAIAACPPEQLVSRRDAWKKAPLAVRIELIRALRDEVLRREESLDLLVVLLTEVEDPISYVVDRGEMIVETALMVLSDPAPIPPSVLKTLRRTVESISDLLPQLYKLRFAAEEVSSRSQPLSVKLTREYLNTAASIVTLLSALLLPKEEDRAFAYLVCQELTDRATVVQNTALEFIESKFSGDVRTYLLTYFEGMTAGEKRQQLASLLRRVSVTVEEIVNRIQPALSAKGDAVAVTLIDAIPLEPYRSTQTSV